MKGLPEPRVPILRPNILLNEIPRHDFHLHTDFTDGKSTIADYAERAFALGLNAIGFPEHCNARSAWLIPFVDAIKAARETWNGKLNLLWGIEAKAIDYSGTLAAPDFMVAAAEYIYGAFHSSLSEIKFTKLTPAEAVDMEYRVTLGMIRARSCHAVAHPGGLSQKYHGGFSIELFDELARQAAAHDVALEINSGYGADVASHLAICQRHECGIVLGSNAHHRDQLGHIIRVLSELDNGVGMCAR